MTRAGIGGKAVEAVGVGFRMLAAEHQGETAAAERESERLDRLREEIAAEDQRRIEVAAQKYSGLTFPPEELTPEPADTGEITPSESEEEPEPEPEPEPVAASPRPRRPVPAAEPVRTNYRSDVRRAASDPLGPF